jgi:hypothetical protein
VNTVPESLISNGFNLRTSKFNLLDDDFLSGGLNRKHRVEDVGTLGVVLRVTVYQTFFSASLTQRPKSVRSLSDAIPIEN